MSCSVNQINKNFNQTIWKTFFGDQKKPTNKAEFYKKLAERGFLIIDTIPYSMKYESKHRKKKAYFELIKSSLDWFHEKLNNSNLEFDKNLKIAFGFKLNAIQFIEATEGELILRKERKFQFNQDNICANGAGFPDSKKLKKIFFEDYFSYKYYQGENQNPYCGKNENPLDFLNPKSLFWYYEEMYDRKLKNSYKNYSEFINNLINNKLSDVGREEKIVWDLYNTNSVK